MTGTSNISPNPKPKGNKVIIMEPPTITPITVNIIFNNKAPAFNANPIQIKNIKRLIIIPITSSKFLY